MALEAKLKIEKKLYSLLECDYEFTQAVDITGRPSDRPRGGVLNLTIVSPDDSDLLFHEWMQGKDLVRSGKIMISVNKGGVFAYKTIEFTDAYCIRLHEYYNDANSLPMYTELSIMAATLTFGGDCTFKMID